MLLILQKALDAILPLFKIKCFEKSPFLKELGLA